MENIQETIVGFDIPKRKLTEEEATRDITLERFNTFHSQAGEDFCDQCESFMNDKIIGGYFIVKFPNLSHEILHELNTGYGIMSLVHLIDENFDDCDETFYKTLAEFANLTEHLKKNINQVLIQVDEYYGNK